MDTVTLVRSAIRGLLKACDSGLAGNCGGRCAVMMTTPPRASRPVTMTTRRRRRELVDALARDARALLAALDGQELEPGRRRRRC
jgi:hypothetical protein